MIFGQLDSNQGKKSRLKKNQPKLTQKFVCGMKANTTLLVETLPDSLYQIQFRWIDQESATCLSQAKSGPLPGFLNKGLLEHSHRHSSTYCLWMFSCSNNRVE